MRKMGEKDWNFGYWSSNMLGNFVFWVLRNFGGGKIGNFSSYWVRFSQANEVRELVIRKGFSTFFNLVSSSSLS